MTSEGKAAYLMASMITETLGFPTLNNKQAKQCALIAVDEILDVLGDAGVYSYADPKVSEYWEQVKNEITKL